MDGLERLVSSALLAADHVSPEGLSAARIVQGATRRRRRRRITAVGSVIVAVTVLAGVVTAIGQGPPASAPAQPTNGVVPWRDDPAVLPPAATREPRSALFSACTSSQLRAGHPDGGVGLGNVSTRIPLTNIGSSGCTLLGYPTSLVGVRPDGSTEVLHAHHGTYFGEGSSDPINLMPGVSTELTLGTGDACDAFNRPTPLPGDPLQAVQVGVPGGGQVLAVAQLDPTCGLGVTRFGPDLPPVEPYPNLYPDLHAELHLPASVPAGSILHFTVVLTNTGTTVLTFHDCPAYQEGSYLGQAQQRTLRLNCDQNPTLNPHETREYAMELPALTMVGTAKVGWSIPTAQAASSGGTTLITAS